jgi:hypothetical protein
MPPKGVKIPMGGGGRSRAGRKNFKGMFLRMMLFLLGAAIWHGFPFGGQLFMAIGGFLFIVSGGFV